MLLRFGRTQFLIGKMLIYTNLKDLEDVVLPAKKQRRPLTFGEYVASVCYGTVESPCYC